MEMGRRYKKQPQFYNHSGKMLHSQKLAELLPSKNPLQKTSQPFSSITIFVMSTFFVPACKIWFFVDFQKCFGTKYDNFIMFWIKYCWKAQFDRYRVANSFPTKCVLAMSFFFHHNCIKSSNFSNYSPQKDYIATLETMNIPRNRCCKNRN